MYGTRLTCPCYVATPRQNRTPEGYGQDNGVLLYCYLARLRLPHFSFLTSCPRPLNGLNRMTILSRFQCDQIVTLFIQTVHRLLPMYNVRALVLLITIQPLFPTMLDFSIIAVRVVKCFVPNVPLRIPSFQNLELRKKSEYVTAAMIKLTSKLNSY